MSLVNSQYKDGCFHYEQNEITVMEHINFEQKEITENDMELIGNLGIWFKNI